MRIIFFGSFLHYSTYVLEALYASEQITVVGCVSTPPMPAGRKKELRKTDTHAWAEAHHIPCYTPTTLTTDTLQTLAALFPDVDYFVVAGYGKLLPKNWLSYPKLCSLNVHFSLLPKYRGANPAEWALLYAEQETGISLIEMAEKFDTGPLLSRSRYQIQATDNRETIYEALYRLGGTSIRNYLEAATRPAASPQGTSPTPYAKRLLRDDGYVPWDVVQAAMGGESMKIESLPALWQQLVTQPYFSVSHIAGDMSDGRLAVGPFLERMIRALYGFPGVWTMVKTGKGETRLKLHAASLYRGRINLDQVQLAGKNPCSYSQISQHLE